MRLIRRAAECVCGNGARACYRYSPLGPQTETNGLQHGRVNAGANFVIARRIDDIQPTALELHSTERKRRPQLRAELFLPHLRFTARIGGSSGTHHAQVADTSMD